MKAVLVMMTIAVLLLSFEGDAQSIDSCSKNSDFIYETNELTVNFASDAFFPKQMMASNTGRYLVTRSPQSKSSLEILDIQSLESVMSFSDLYRKKGDYTFSKDDSLFAIYAFNGTVSIYSTQSREKKYEIELGKTIVSLRFADENSLWVAPSKGAPFLFDLNSNTVAKTLSDIQNYESVSDLNIDYKNRIIGVGVESRIRLYDLDTGEYIEKFILSGNAHKIVFSKNGEFIGAISHHPRNIRLNIRNHTNAEYQVTIINLNRGTQRDAGDFPTLSGDCYADFGEPELVFSQDSKRFFLMIDGVNIYQYSSRFVSIEDSFYAPRADSIAMNGNRLLHLKENKIIEYELDKPLEATIDSLHQMVNTQNEELWLSIYKNIAKNDTVVRQKTTYLKGLFYYNLFAKTQDELHLRVAFIDLRSVAITNFAPAQALLGEMLLAYDNHKAYFEKNLNDKPRNIGLQLISWAADKGDKRAIKLKAQYANEIKSLPSEVAKKAFQNDGLFSPSISEHFYLVDAVEIRKIKLFQHSGDSVTLSTRLVALAPELKNSNGLRNWQVDGELQLTEQSLVLQRSIRVIKMFGFNESCDDFWEAPAEKLKIKVAKEFVDSRRLPIWQLITQNSTESCAVYQSGACSPTKCLKNRSHPDFDSLNEGFFLVGGEIQAKELFAELANASNQMWQM